MKRLTTPIAEEEIQNLHIGDRVLISGKIYCGRDAVLPKICALLRHGTLEQYGINLQGSVIFHTAVSPAGIGPTSSNKLEIESSMAELARAGVKIHLGKGAIQDETVSILNKYNSIFAVIPPITALLQENTISQKIVMFPELGMEGFYELEIKDYPAIVAAVHNISIYGGKIKNEL